MPPRAIEVWWARPSGVPDGQWPVLEALLDPLERERALRFRQHADRRSWVLAHALRRLVLGDWLGLPPASLRLADKAGAKPVLLAPAGHGLHFSHSRRRGVVAFAVTSHGPIGIDVEELRDRNADFALLARHMVAPELEFVSSADGERVRAFFSCWTALEAFWKADGAGLAAGNPRLRCNRRPGVAGELSLEHNSVPAARWWAIDAVPDHAIALALKYVDPHARRVVATDPPVRVADGKQLIQSR